MNAKYTEDDNDALDENRYLREREAQERGSSSLGSAIGKSCPPDREVKDHSVVTTRTPLEMHTSPRHHEGEARAQPAVRTPVHTAAPAKLGRRQADDQVSESARWLDLLPPAIYLELRAPVRAREWYRGGARYEPTRVPDREIYKIARTTSIWHLRRRGIDCIVLERPWLECEMLVEVGVHEYFVRLRSARRPLAQSDFLAENIRVAKIVVGPSGKLRAARRDRAAPD